MSWSDFAGLVTGKRPVWLYEITAGGTVNRLTSGLSDFTYGGNTYASTALTHGRINVSRSVKRADTNIVFPRSNALAVSIRDSVTALETTVRILHGFSNDPDQEFLPRFTGRVVGVKPTLGTIALMCESGVTRFRSKMIAPVIQRTCRHALYGYGCSLNIADFQTAGTATDLTGKTLSVTEAAAQADGYYSGGVVEFGGKRQMIRSHTGSTLRLLSTLEGVGDEITSSGSASVLLAPGCNRSLTVCDTRFSNSLNFGGFPGMDESPFDQVDLFNGGGS